MNKNVNLDQFMFAASTILYKMLVCLSESRGGSSFGESIFSYCGQRYCYNLKQNLCILIYAHVNCNVYTYITNHEAFNFVTSCSNSVPRYYSSFSNNAGYPHVSSAYLFLQDGSTTDKHMNDSSYSTKIQIIYTV